MFRKKISRRRFMKTGLAWMAGTAASTGSLLGATGDKNKTGVSRTSLKPLNAIPTTCEQCPAGCGVIALLQGEKLVQILGNPDHPNNQGSLCAKGIAGINLVNDPERLLYPMKREGERGGNTWTRITWDEVYSTLSDRIKKMIIDERTAELFIDMGQTDPLLAQFAAAVGQPNIINRQSLKNLNRDTAMFSMVGSPFLMEDVGRSRTILNFGANPYSNHDQFIGMARRLVHARIEKGAKLITFDVRMSETAAQSDAWYPVQAGTDAIVALAMANVIIDEDLADKDFIGRQTNTPLSQIKRHISKYTPEAAESESGVKSADIHRLAVEFATRKPSVAIIGGGICDHENGTQSARCVYLLNWLVGNLEEEGGLFFPRQPDTFPSHTDHLKIPLQKAHSQVDIYFAYLANPLYADPDSKSTARFFQDEKNVPFLVVMDTHLTETAMMADMLLPAATYLEGWGISWSPTFERHPVVALRQPVVSLISSTKALRSPDYDMGKLLEPTFKPKGEASEIGNVCLELARWIGSPAADRLPYKDTEDYCVKTVSQIPGLVKQGGFKQLKREGLWVEKDSEKSPPAAIRSVEISSRTFMDNKLGSLPEYQAVSFRRDLTENEFILTTFKSNLITKGTSNSKWAREIFHENPLWINKAAASRLGIQEGNKVRISSSVGTFIASVLITNRIHPKSAALAEGFGHTAGGNVAQARKFKSIDQDTDLIWWYKSGNGVNPSEIIEKRTDPLSSGPGLKDTVIRVEKIT